MAEPPANPPPSADATARAGTLPVIAICVVDALMAVSELAYRHIPNAPAQSGIPPFPHWFRPFLDGHAVALIIGVVGLALMRRWGFLVTMVAYFALIVGLLLAHQPWSCAAITQFPLFAILSLQWKRLR